MFKVGDRVRTLTKVGHATEDTIGFEGKVIEVNNHIVCVSVEFDDDIKGHNACGKGRDGHCWYCLKENLEKIKEKKMEYEETTLENDVECAGCGNKIPAGETVYIVDGEYYDEDCFHEEFFICDGCGNLERTENGFYYDDGMYCEDCRDDNFVRCYDCDEWVRKDDAYRIADRYGNGDEYICQGCRDNDWTCCDDCGELFRCDDTYEGRDGYYYCSDCIGDHRGGDVICEYHCGPSLEYYRIEDGRRISSTSSEDFKGYGFELEVDRGGQDDDNAQSVIDMLHDEVYCAEDGSIDDGFEIISHPHTREAMESMPMDDVLDWLVERGYRSHDAGTCGLHLHASKSLFGNCEKTRIQNISKIVLFYEKFWNDILKISRRTQSQADSWASNYCNDDKSIKDMVDKAIKGDRYAHGRYYAVNLCNKDTIEFRLMRGTLNKKTFWATLDFLMTCVENTKKIKMGEIGRADLWLKGMKPETLEYIKSRGAFADVLGTNETSNEGGDVE